MTHEGIPVSELKTEALRAREEIAPAVLRLKCLFQVWNCFLCSEEVAKEFCELFEGLSFRSKMAFTRGLIIEYAKPFQSNNGKAIKAVKQDTGFAFLDEVLGENDLHKSLWELRQRLVAHTNEFDESISINFRGTVVENAPASGDRADRTLERVRLPVLPVVKTNRGLWWINNHSIVDAIRLHSCKCKEATQEFIRGETIRLRDLCIQNMHVLDRLEDLVGFSQLESEEDLQGTANHFDIKMDQERGQGLPIASPRSTRIGDEHLASLSGVIAPGIAFESGTEISGPGFVFRVKADSSTARMQFTVSFPRFPDEKA